MIDNDKLYEYAQKAATELEEAGIRYMGRYWKVDITEDERAHVTGGWMLAIQAAGAKVAHISELIVGLKEEGASEAVIHQALAEHFRQTPERQAELQGRLNEMRTLVRLGEQGEEK